MSTGREEFPSSESPDAVELEIDSLAAGGRGVARHEGRVWFVPGGVPGDLLIAVPERPRPRYVVGRTIRMLRPSPHRREPFCPIQSRCGGCPWMPLPEAAQRDWKRRLVVDALVRIGRIPDPPVEPVFPAPAQRAYRNRIELILARGPGGEPRLGFRGRAGVGGVVDVERCPVQHGDADEVLRHLREILLAPRGPWKDLPRSPTPFRVLLRRSWHDGAMLVGLHETGRPFPRLGELAEALMRRCGQVTGVVRVRGPAGRRGGTRATAVRGRSAIDERLGDLVFRISATSFAQVQTQMVPVLVDRVRAAAGPVDGKAVLDLYGGIGVIGLHLARDGARATIVEANPTALDDARASAERAGLSPRLLRGAVERVLAGLALEPDELVIANPPRGGLADGAVAAIAGRRPASLIVVSCDPATLARDVRRLARHGFELARVESLDMFPQTAHVECVASLRPRDRS